MNCRSFLYVSITLSWKYFCTTILFLVVLAKVQLKNEGNVVQSNESYYIQGFGSLNFGLLYKIVPAEVFGEHCEDNARRNYDQKEQRNVRKLRSVVVKWKKVSQCDSILVGI